MTNSSISFFETQQFNAIIFIVLGFICMFIGTMVTDIFYDYTEFNDVLIWFFMILAVTFLILSLVCVHKSYEEDEKNATNTSM